jgi:DivIVA domain-containing protein
VALDRHSIEKKDFPLGTRGYDPDAVDAHLSALADEVATYKEEARRRSDTMASSASERVRTIVEAAEQSAAEIHKAAEEDARELRQEASNEAASMRENAQREAREYLDRVTASTNAMMERVNAMDQEMNAMIESVRAGSNRLTADLQQLERGLEDVLGDTTPRPAFIPDEPLAPAGEAQDTATGWPEPATGLHEPAADVHQPDMGELDEPQFAERFQPAAEEPPAQAAPGPEAAEFQSVAGDGGHTNGFDQPEPAPQGGDAEGARLIALNMALNGTPREETARYLSENFHLSDAGGLLDEVYASVEG